MSVLRMIKVLPLGVALLLAGCFGGDDLSDLKRWTAEVQTRPAPPIEPLPQFRPYESFSYSAASKRSPFEPPLKIKPKERLLANTNVKPDPNRPKEYLEEFNVEGMKMVGTLLGSDKIFWALINDGRGGIHRVKIGNYLGRNHGRITEINDLSVSLMEIVPDGRGGWVERPRTLALESKE